MLLIKEFSARFRCGSGGHKHGLESVRDIGRERPIGERGRFNYARVQSGTHISAFCIRFAIRPPETRRNETASTKTSQHARRPRTVCRLVAHTPVRLQQHRFGQVTLARLSAWEQHRGLSSSCGARAVRSCDPRHSSLSVATSAPPGPTNCVRRMGHVVVASGGGLW
jgi:hypothetical protein